MISPQLHRSPLNYRPDIDGLRAVAVLFVMAYHAFPNWVKGGFIGVDVFFVISGYLISTIIFGSLEAGTFSFAEFYARRIRRIFPALLLVLGASYAFGWFALVADEYKQLGKHIAAGAGFVSNIVLWNEAGYFDHSADTKPLLHLWSLGIEEQFYIVWPLLLWLAWKQKFSLLIVTTLVAGASFYLNLTGVHEDAVAAFYFPHTRFWELLCGSLLAWVTLYNTGGLRSLTSQLDRWFACVIYRHKPESTGNGLRNVLSFFGLFLLAYGFWRINRDFSFPGLWAIIPAFGAALIISAGPAAWVNRILLSSRPAVWLGLISFPLYLWHWPLLSFARIVENETPTGSFRLAAILLSIVLAWLTYKFIEQPIRSGTQPTNTTAALLALMLMVGSVGYFTYSKNGLGFRFPEIVQELLQYQYDFGKHYRQGTCFLNFDQNFNEFAKCDTKPAHHEQAVLLWGDSHAAHLYPGYKAAFGQHFNIMQRTASGCPPILGLEIPDKPHCKEINSKMLSVIRDTHPTRVVLSAVWTNYDLAKLDDTVLRIRALGVTNIDLIGPVPQWVDVLPKQLYAYFKNFVPHVIPYRMNFGLNENFVSVDYILNRKASRLHINYISPKDILCDANGCLTRLGETGETLTAWDHGHLTNAGSEYLVSKFPKL